MYRQLRPYVKLLVDTYMYFLFVWIYFDVETSGYGGNTKVLSNSRPFIHGRFIWNLWNEPLVSFVNFIWNDHECKILFIIRPCKMSIILWRKHINDTVIVNDITCMCQNPGVVIRCKWKTVMSNDKCIPYLPEFFIIWDFSGLKICKYKVMICIMIIFQHIPLL